MQALTSLLYTVFFYFWTALVSLLGTPLFFCPQRWTLVLFHIWGRGLVAALAICRIKVEVRGQIPQGAALVAPKHQCLLDVVAQYTWLPAATFVMKKELGWIPWFGWYAFKSGCIVIDRGGAAKTMRQVIREGTERFKDGRQVVIFPEGTRKAPGAEPDYKPGIAALYRELNVPVVPVATNAGVHWPAHGMMRRPGTIVFEYLEPIPPGLKRAEFMRLLQERIETRSNELLAEGL